MKIQKQNNIKWFLDDDELFIALKDIPLQEELKRGYFNCNYKDKQVFIKFFQEKGIAGFIKNRVAPRGKKEYLAGKNLLALSIVTPKPLGYGISDKGSYIIQEWTGGDTFVNVFLKSQDRTELLVKLADLLSMLKKYRVLHNDLHLNDIIIYNNNLYLINLQKMQIKKHFIRKKDEVSSLSHTIIMLYGIITTDEKTLFFDRYGDRSIRAPVEYGMGKLREKWIREKQERAFKNTSKIAVRKDYIYIAEAEIFVDSKPVRLIKKDKKIIVERYNDHIRKYYRNRRRLKRAWKNHVALKYLDLCITPEPYFVKRPSLFSWGFIAMEDLIGSGAELDRYLDRTYNYMNKDEKTVFIKTLAEFFASLFKNKIAHMDIKGCNIFALNNGGFLLLDVEDILFTVIDKERLKRMLVQLNTTIPARINVNDRMRFYLKVTKSINIDKKQIFKDVQKRSLENAIVYEGVSGLQRESW